MRDDLTSPPRCIAATPTLGVRLWITRDAQGRPNMVGLHVANEGGRGAALARVLVPVTRGPGAAVEPAMDLKAFLAADAAAQGGVRDLQWRSDKVLLPTPAPLRWYGDQWRTITRHADAVLVLMLYPNLRANQTGIQSVRDGVAAIESFFRQLRDRPAPQHATWVRRGLVQLAAADIPNSVNPHANGPAQPDASPNRPVAAPGGQGMGSQSPARPANPPPESCAPGAAAFTLALASCHYPAGLVDGTPRRFGGDASPAGPADASMLRLAALLEDLPHDHSDRPSLLLLAGDQIYADATAGLFDPRAGATPKVRSGIRQAEDWLRIPYQNWLGGAGAQAVLGQVSTRMVLDDHEIDNNWEPTLLPGRPGEVQRIKSLLRAGKQAYQRYQRDLRDAALSDSDVLWDDLVRHRGVRFFLADTRTERGPRSARQDPLLPRILDPAQATRLHGWITEETDRPAFIVSSAMLLPRRRRSTANLRAALHSDAWDGYPGSLYRLLVHIWKTSRSNLVFLSGDEHLSSVVRATVTQCRTPGRAVTLHSVHSSGLYAPYPFANAVAALFALPDDWTFEDPDQPGMCYRCVVEPCADWAPGDGFALLRLTPPGSADEGSSWQLDVQFDRAAGPVRVPPLALASGPGPLQEPLD